MNNRLSKYGSLLFVSLAILAIPIGCATRLDPEGVYKGDKVLYNADRVINSSYRIVHDFVTWEQQYRNSLPADVSRAADRVRQNARATIQSAVNVREAYAQNPTDSAKSGLIRAIDVLQALLDEALGYMSKGAPTNVVTNGPPVDAVSPPRSVRIQ